MISPPLSALEEIGQYPRFVLNRHYADYGGVHFPRSRSEETTWCRRMLSTRAVRFIQKRTNEMTKIAGEIDALHTKRLEHVLLRDRGRDHVEATPSRDDSRVMEQERDGRGCRRRHQGCEARRRSRSRRMGSRSIDPCISSEP